MNKKLVLCILMLIFSMTFVHAEDGIVQNVRKTNVILMIGDGMGIAQIAAAHYRKHGTTKGKLAMESLPVTGYSYTFSKNYLVSESASSGTALATGYKTNNSMISVLPDGTKLKTLLEACRDSGMKTGLIATSSITHATPAVFAAHIDNRKRYLSIASMMLASRVDVMFGGGQKYFLPVSRGGMRKDGRDLFAEAKNSGYQVIFDQRAFNNVKGLPVLGLFQKTSLSTVPGKEPSLAELTLKALKLLDKPQKGFFLMVEGSRIDWGCHAHDIHDASRQTLLFDSAVRIARRFAKADRNTLLIVTADHECGGMAINWGSPTGKNLKPGWTTKGHTAVPVPVFAFGPGQENFTGVYDNTLIPRKIAGIIGLTDFPKKLDQ